MKTDDILKRLYDPDIMRVTLSTRDVQRLMRESRSLGFSEGRNYLEAECEGKRLNFGRGLAMLRNRGKIS